MHTYFFVVMSSIDDALDRPEFDVMALDIGVDEAHQHIQDAVKGLTEAASAEGLRYRTHDGRLVAILAEAASGTADESATLAHRTAPLSESATRKARKIHDALESHVADN